MNSVGYLGCKFDLFDIDEILLLNDGTASIAYFVTDMKTVVQLQPVY